MARSIKIPFASGIALLLCSSMHIVAAQKTPAAPPSASASQTFALTDTKDLDEEGVKAEAVEYRGRKAVRLTTIEDADVDGFAFVNGTQFHDGTIEVDVAAKSTRPPGARMPGFIGIAFRARRDAAHYDLFYIRPGNSRSEDQAMRNHSVQYGSAPGFGGEKLRRQWPFIYEAYADLQPEVWT